MALQINPEKGLIVRVPNKASDSDIEELLEQKINWIIKKLAIAKQRASEVPRHDYRPGDIFHLMGEKFVLTYSVGKRDLVETTGFFLSVTLKPDTPQEKVPELIRKWYINRAREIVNERVVSYSRSLGVRPNRISIRSQSKRWGSCSAKGNLNFNWKLVMAPPEILDYVVAHELCHMLYLDHQKDFWKTLKKVMPDYQYRRKWLKDNGHRLGL